MKVAYSKHMNAADKKTIEEIKIPGVLLMEAAAQAVFNACIKKLPNKNAKVLIFAGGGNNGGDGLAIARMLYNKSISTEIIFIGNLETVRGDAKVQLDIIKNLPIPFEVLGGEDLSGRIRLSDVVIDAIYGIGLKGLVRGRIAEVIGQINANAKYIIAVDIPSGINGDTGHISGTAIKANETVTFCMPKVGLLLFPGAEYAGEITVADIGIPQSVQEELDTNLFTLRSWQDMLPKRPRRSNKGTFGKLLCIAGSQEMPGAAALVCRAASRCGTGLVCCALPKSIAPVVQSKVTECITKLLPEINGAISESAWEVVKPLLNSYDALAIGPGLGRNRYTEKFLEELLRTNTKPLVLDADGLNGISDNTDILAFQKAPCVITPHPGEMSRLTGLPISEILDNPLEISKRFAAEWNVVVVLKDSHTIIASRMEKCI